MDILSGWHIVLSFLFHIYNRQPQVNHEPDVKKKEKKKMCPAVRFSLWHVAKTAPFPPIEHDYKRAVQLWWRDSNNFFTAPQLREEFSPLRSALMSGNVSDDSYLMTGKRVTGQLIFSIPLFYSTSHALERHQSSSHLSVHPLCRSTSATPTHS